MNWQEVTQDPEFQALNDNSKYKVLRGYYKDNVASDSEYRALPQEAKFKILRGHQVDAGLYVPERDDPKSVYQIGKETILDTSGSSFLDMPAKWGKQLFYATERTGAGIARMVGDLAAESERYPDLVKDSAELKKYTEKFGKVEGGNKFWATKSKDKNWLQKASSEASEYWNKKYQDEERKFKAAPGSLKSGVDKLGTTIVRMLPAMGASFATGNPAIGASMIGTDVFGSEYNDQKDAGSSTVVAIMAAFAASGAEFLGEKYSIGVLMKDGGSLLRDLSKGMAAEGTEELVTGILQAGIRKGTIEPNMTWTQAWNNILDDYATGGFAGLFFAGAGHTFRRSTGQSQDSQAKDSKSPVSNTRTEEHPPSFTHTDKEGNYVRPMVDENGDPVEGVWEYTDGIMAALDPNDIATIDAETEPIATEINIEEELTKEEPKPLKTQKEVVSEVIGSGGSVDDAYEALSLDAQEKIESGQILKKEKVVEPQKEESAAFPQEDKINSITREEAGKMMAEGDPEVIEHIREGVEEKGSDEVAHAIRNQEMVETSNVPKGPEREAVRANIEKLKPEINQALSEEKPQEPWEIPSTELEGQYTKSVAGQEESLKEARKETDTSPTEAQIEAGNYKKGHVSIQGLDISIENPKGSTRSGEENGKKWSTEMRNDYGYIKNSKGADKENVDVYIGDKLDSDQVFVVHQVDPATRKYDEDKVMVGFDTQEEAETAYRSQYDQDKKTKPDRIGMVTPMDMKTFKKKIKKGGPLSQEAVSKLKTSGPTLDMLGLQQIYERVSETGSIQDNMKALSEAGTQFYRDGAKTFNSFRAKMQEWLGDKWINFKKHMLKVFNSAKKAVANERGAIGWEGKIPTSKVKHIVRQQTGQIKVSNLMDERIALREIMKAQQTASRKGFIEGRKKGITIQKTYAERVKEAQKARAELQARIDNAVNKIQTLPTKNLPLDYKKKIEEVKVGFDLNKRMAATLRKRISLEDFIQRQTAKGETINIPTEHIKMLNRKTLGEMTVEEIEGLADTILKLAHIGATKRELKGLKVERDLEETIDDLTKPMLETGKTFPSDIPVTEASRKEFRPGKIKSAIKSFAVKNIRPERILEALDNYEDNGPNYTTIYEPVEGAANDSFLGQHGKTKKIEQAVKIFKLDLHEIASNPRKINDHLTLTGEEMMEVYIATFDGDKMRHLQYGNKLSDQDIYEVVDKMPANEKEFVKWEVLNYWKPQYPEVNGIYEELYNVSLPHIPGYSSIQIDKDLSNISSYDQDLAEELMGRQQLNPIAVERGFTKARTEGAKQPLSLKHFDNLWRNIRKVEHFKAFALKARDLRKIINHPDYKSAVVDTAGPMTYKVLNTWLDDVITQRPYMETPAAPIMGMLRNHTAVAMLGFNMVTGLKQTASFFTASSLVNTPSILSGMLQVAKNPKAVETFAYARSPQLKSRSVERDIQELMSKAKTEKIFAGKKELASRSMEFIQYFDKKTVLSVWKGAYDYQLKKTGDEQASIKFADKIIRRTQPSFDVKDLPAFFRGGELEKMLTMFMNQRNQNWNIFAHDIIGKAKAGKISKAEAARRLWWMWTVPAVMLAAISKGGNLPDDKEKLGMDLVQYSPIAGLFLIGPLMDSLITGWDWSLPVFQAAKELGTTVKSKKTGAKIKHGIKSASYAAGIPINQFSRTFEGMADLLNGKTNDLRRLIWSKYALKDKQSKDISDY